MAKGEGLGIALPPQAKPDKASFDIRSGPLAKWLNALPTVNTGETTKLIYQVLLDVNRHSHDWQRRYHFLEAIREPLDGVQRALNRHYTGQGFPLPAKSQQIATLSHRLHIEMAYGYLAAIDSMLEALVLFQDRRALKIMVHRACRYLNLSLLVSYQTYTQQPVGIWQQLHRLYAFAEVRDIHQDSIRDPLFTELPESSIARIYKQSALLATVSPFRLRQGEVAAIHQALANWSSHAKLLQGNEHGAASALFLLHLDSDEEPEYRALASRPCDNHCRYIDTHQLVHLLQEAGFAGRVISPELSKSLIQCWEAPPTRGEQRNQGDSHVEAAVGMNKVHPLLAPSLQGSVVHDNKAHFDARPLRGGERRSSANDIWNVYSASGGGGQAAPARKPVNASQEPLPEVSLLHWQVRDTSPGGLRLALPEGQEGGVRVGELLALRDKDTHQQWQLGQVRWLRRTANNGLECGVQILAPQMIAVMVSRHTPNAPQGESQRGLLLPGDGEQALAATLIVPARYFKPADTVLLHATGNEMEVILDGAIQENGTFVQFEFHTGAEREEEPPAKEASGTEQPFDKVWELL